MVQMTCEEYARHKRLQREMERRAAMTPEERERYLAARREYARRYRQNPNNIDKLYAKNKAWRERPENREKARAYYYEHHERCLEYQAAYRERRRQQISQEARRMAARQQNEAGKARAAQWPDGVRQDLREWRKRHGMTQQSMAERCGFALNYISKMETGWLPPSEKVLEMIGITWRPGEYMGPYQRRYGFGTDAHSICNHCIRTDCAWMTDHVPVEGWKARLSEQRYNTKTTLTWHVEACPCYTEDNTRSLY